MSEQKRDICKNCAYAKPAGYRQVICKKTDTFQVEVYSCSRFKDKQKTH